jgi:hypothetical protein
MKSVSQPSQKKLLSLSREDKYKYNCKILTSGQSKLTRHLRVPQTDVEQVFRRQNIDATMTQPQHQMFMVPLLLLTIRA